MTRSWRLACLIAASLSALASPEEHRKWLLELSHEKLAVRQAAYDGLAALGAEDPDALLSLLPKAGADPEAEARIQRLRELATEERSLRRSLRTMEGNKTLQGAVLLFFREPSTDTLCALEESFRQESQEGKISQILMSFLECIRLSELPAYSDQQMQDMWSEQALFWLDGPPNVPMRAIAIEALGRTRDPAAAEVAARFLDDPSFAVQRAACRLADGKRNADVITRLLMSPDARVREAALRALVSAGCQERVPQIRPLLNDPDTTVQRDAIKALVGAFRDPEAIRSVSESLPALKDGLLIEALRSLPADPGLAEQVISLLDRPHPSVRREAGRFLERCRVPCPTDRIIALLEKDPHLGAQLAGLSRDQSLVAPLKKSLKNQRGIPRFLSAVALVRLGELWATGEIACLLDDKTDPPLRDRAVSALAEIAGRDPADPIWNLAAAAAWWEMNKNDPRFSDAGR